MFLENTLGDNKQRGAIEVICGSMFSGKTEELIRRLRRAKIARQKVKIFKPQIDTRYSAEEVVSHNATSIPSIAVSTAAQIYQQATDSEVIGIDEAQFFDMELVPICNELANKGIRIIIAGLDMDFKGNPFGPIPSLMAIAEHVTKVHAICMRCGDLAQYSHRLSKAENLVVIGEKDEYEPLCRQCYYQIMNKYNL